ncbi:hypothetical protein [Methylomonas rosea]|uniref:Uncharacterized protein n=1 Tax=Methylomonas rosea TaxID=2952227 RepID=A0ABT1TNM1_9GAMM|nr:hypothetical protein [Methylomonas sp. WSC-7]MCQ8116130.1 hypothetical protein [Methylomonas sp. WSC-7]
MSDAKRKPGGQAGNQNPKKAEDDIAKAQVQFRCRSEDKGKWQRAAEKAYGKGKFTEFLKDAANRLADDILNR